MPKTAANPPAKLHLSAAARQRPQPPFVVTSELLDTMAPDAAFAQWVQDTFIAPESPLYNADHEHLADARIGVLWTNAPNSARGHIVMATAEIPGSQAGGWKRTRHDFQLRQWFGATPDFLLTFSTEQCGPLSDRAFCAVVEHELYHCAQQIDEGGNLKFHRETGLPLFRILGHDVEEFVGVVARYGVVNSAVDAMVRAANRAPGVAGDAIEIACGLCLAKAA